MLFLTVNEDEVLKVLEQTLPEGIHKSEEVFSSGANGLLVLRGFAVESDGGYVYCTVRGIKYLQDQNSRLLVKNIYGPVKFPMVKLTLWQKMINLFFRVLR
jgi:hypothetical protein